MAKKGGAPTKSEIVAHICKDAELSRKQVAAVFESLNGIIKKSLRGPGLFTLPGLLKMKVVKKPATKAREGINPFTKEKMVFKAKPASKKVRVLPLKSLKGSGLFTLPGLAKMKVVKKPATKAREGVNPFTGQKMMFKAKPASKKVRVMPLKNLKNMVN